MKSTQDNPAALKPEGDTGTEYVLDPDHPSVWIRVKNLSVYVRQCDEGVGVDIFVAGSEMDDSIAGTWALYQEASNACDHQSL